MMETELLDKAIALAQTAHANQVDKAKDWKRLKKYQEVLPQLQAALSHFESS